MRSLASICIFAALTTGPVWGEKFALLIGINDYAHARKLKGAVNDITAIRGVLARDLKLADDNIEVLLNARASKQAILQGLESLATRSRAGDTILIYYSGHGWLVNDVDGDEGAFDAAEKFDEALVPADAVPWPKERAHEPNPTLLIDDEIAVRLAKLRGRRLAVVFDSCHAGSGLRGLPGEDETRSLYDDAPLPASKFKSLTPRKPTLDLTGQLVFFAAARWRETASDMGDFDGQRHGALTASLLRTIKQAGPGWQKNMTWEGLARQVREDLKQRGITSQTPTLAAPPALARVPVEQFFDPLPAAEVAEITAPAAFEVYLEVNKYQFVEGELLEVAVESERDGYVYLFDVNPEGKVTQLLPNRFEPDNHISPATLRKVPGARDRYQFRAGKPFGTSTLVAFVTRQPWTDLTRLNLPASLQPISEEQKRAFAVELHDMQDQKAVEWSVQKVSVEVVSERATEVAVARPPQPVAPTPTAPAVPARPAAAASDSRRDSEDDSNITPQEELDLERLRPALYRKLEGLAARYSPVFWQDVSGDGMGRFRPWKDFFVRYDFDRTRLGPNWPAPQGFQDETKRVRNRALDAVADPSGKRTVVPVEGKPGVFQVTNDQTGETVELDLRPAVYWAVMTTSTHYFFHYVAFKAEDWKPLFGHTGDLEGTTVVVDRATEKPVAVMTLAHDDVEVTRGLDDEPESNIELMVAPSLETRALSPEGKERPVNGSLEMEPTREGEPSAKEHQNIYSETRGHGQYGPHRIHPARYVVYANFLPDETWTVPPFEQSMYPVTDKFEEVRAKHKYKLIYVGSGRTKAQSPEEKTLWSEYREIRRFPGGVNPPWCWRDKLWFRTGWWRDPRTIVAVGASKYRINPYLE